MNTENNHVIFYVTDDGLVLARRIKGLYNNADIVKFGAEKVRVCWREYRHLIFIMASGIAVRTIASLTGDERTGPAVVVIDEKGKYVVSLLNGHIDDANDITREVADYIGGELLVPDVKPGSLTGMEREDSGIDRAGEARSQTGNPAGKGTIFIVGTGPGRAEHISFAVRNAILRSDVIVGYGTYIDLIEDLIGDKEVVSTGMTKEVDRCEKAIEIAEGGKTVSVISGGDPGIYAMAGLVYEILRSRGKGIGNQKIESVEVIPGISALNAAAARLGAPLMHDFASISLSDRLTPWEVISKRVEAASFADFVIVLYNPKSKGRPWQIGRALEIIMRYRPADTPVGIVRGAMRDDEYVIITDLGHMLDHDIDMQTTVIIGNSKTFVWNNLMITPRGYESKYGPGV